MSSKELSKKHNQLIHDCGDVKQRVKLYKKGRNWVAAGITTVAFSLFTLGGMQVAHADTAADATTSTDTSQTDVNAGKTESQTTLRTATSAISDSTATQQTQASSATSTATDQSDVTSQKAADSVSNSAANDNQNDKSASKEVVTNLGAASAEKVTQVKQTAAQTYQATKQSQNIVAYSAPDPVVQGDPITVNTTAAQTETKLGGDAVFAIELNDTGIKTSALNASLKIDLPKGTTLDGDLSKYAIAGVTPTDENGQVVYQFANLPAGTVARMVYNLKTDKSVLKNGDQLTFADTFTADGVDPITGSATTKVTSADLTSITTLATTITDPSGTVKKYASSGDNVTWTIGGQVYTSQPGVDLVDPSQPIVVTYAIDKNLTYVSAADAGGSNVTIPDPTITTDANGNTVLTWKIEPGTIASQLAADPTFKIDVKTKIKNNTADWTTVTSAPKIDYTTNNGTAVSKQNTTPSPSVLVTNGHPESYTEVGNVFMLGQISSADGKGGTDPSQDVSKNIDPVVVSEDNPILSWIDMMSENYAGIYNQDTLHQVYGDYKYFALYQRIDPGEILQNLYLSPAKYLPNYSYYAENGMKNLAIAPTVTLAVQYTGESSYKVLADNLAVDGSVNLNRAQLIQMGLDPNKDVANVWIYYHKDGEGKLPDIKPQNLNKNTAWNDHTDGTSTMNLPAGSWAPLGLYEPVYFTTSVKPGFTGKISHDFVPQYIIKTTDKSTLTGLSATELPSEIYFLQPSDKTNGLIGSMSIANLASTVEVTSEPKGTSRIVTSDVLVDNQASGSQLTVGQHAVTVSATLSADSLSKLLGQDAFSFYTILDKGVSLAPGNTNATVVDGNYNGTGQQLVKVIADQKTYLTPGQKASATFNVNINDAAASTLHFNVTFMSPMDDIKVPTSQDEHGETSVLGDDTADIDQNGQTDQKTVSANIIYQLLRNNQLQITGDVSGTDGNYSKEASATADSDVTVRLQTTDSTDANLQQLNLVDWLPMAGDKGLTTNDTRGSAFTPTLTGPITLPTAWQGKVKVQYTTDLNATNDPSTATWVDESGVTDWSKVTGFWLSLDAAANQSVPGPGQVVTFKLHVPADAKTGDVAYNTFYMNSNTLTSTEPNEVAIKVVAKTPGGGTTTPPDNNPGGGNPPTTNPQTTPPTTTGENTVPPTTTPQEQGNTTNTNNGGKTTGGTNVSVTPMNGTTVKGQATENAAANKLPQTSESNPQAGAIIGLGLLTSLLGLFGVDLKRRVK